MSQSAAPHVSCVTLRARAKRDMRTTFRKLKACKARYDRQPVRALPVEILVAGSYPAMSLTETPRRVELPVDQQGLRDNSEASELAP